MVSLPLYEDIAIFLVFFVYKDTVPDLFEMEIGVAGPIFTHNNIY